MEKDENKDYENTKLSEKNLSKDNLISVIVPVYNVSKFLENCVDSILQQTYGNLEVILVDDGSNDCSGKICDRYAELDRRVVVIHKTNGGLSSARNAGLDIARGNFVSFIDGDDYIHPRMYETMLSILLIENANMVSCGYQMVAEQDIGENGVIHREFGQTGWTVIKGREIYWQLWLRDNETVVQWNKLFCRELFNECRYPLGKYHEDVYIIHQLLGKCQKIVYVEADFYYYVQRQNSIMHSESRQQVQDAVEGYEQRIQFFLDKELYYEYEQTLKVLFEYFIWKYEQVKTKWTKEDTKWLIRCYREKYVKYYKKIDYTKEQKILFMLPQYYESYVNKTKYGMGIGNRIKRRLKNTVVKVKKNAR